MIAHWPREIQTNNGLSNFSGHFIDIMATIVDITGAKYPKEFRGQKIVPMQGMSLLPIMQGETVERGKPLFWQWQKGKAVREGKWKIVAHGKDADWELFNVDEDPTEINNLASMQPEIVIKMDALYNSWMQENEQWN